VGGAGALYGLGIPTIEGFFGAVSL
jgi:hypothetical protein